MNREQRCSGFTLVEMAIVMVIVGLMLGGLMMSLAQTRENTRRSDAQGQLEEIVDALYGFAQARGRLPCPATPASSGAEAPPGGGTCSRQHGFVPAASLGLSGPVNGDGLLLDPWNSPYRYSVTNANSWAFTTADGMRTSGMATLTPDLRVCRQAACSTPIAEVIPAVVLSTGKNWANFTSADETANAGEATVGGGPSGSSYRIAGNRDFVSTDYSEANFDDLLTWLSPNILYTRMIAAGRLP
jgi:prepilin-type N-terminal cleavage/methylation domain-containing protein